MFPLSFGKTEVNLHENVFAAKTDVFLIGRVINKNSYVLVRTKIHQLIIKRKTSKFLVVHQKIKGRKTTEIHAGK